MRLHLAPHRTPRATTCAMLQSTFRLALRILPAIAGLFALLGGPSPAQAGNGTWSGVSPRAKSIEAIVRDPLTPSRLWAATFGAGVYRSLDGGSTWTGSRTGLVNTFTRCLAVEPNHPDSVYCGSNDGVFLSVDGGVTWSKLLSTTFAVRSIKIHPVRTGVIYAATSGTGVFKSVNGGKNWAAINLGLTNSTVRDVALEPQRPDTLIAATGTNGGLHRSLNGGLTWTQLADTTGSLNGTHGAAEEIQFDALDPQRISVAELDRGVLQSLDGGTTWARLNAGLTSLRGRSLDVVDNMLYFGTDGGGLFWTSFNDVTWHGASTGLSALVVTALAPATSGSLSQLAGTDGGGIDLTVNSGASWTALDGGLLNTFGFSLAVRPGTHEVYAGTGFGDQFWKSANAGATWTRASYLFSHDSEHGLAPDPLQPNVIYLSAYGAGVYASADDGVTWSRPDTLDTSLTNRFVRPLVAWPGESGHLLVGTGIGPFESVNGGASWKSLVNNLPASFSVRSLALVPGVPATIYVGSDTAGVYRSTDGGSNWTAINTGLGSMFVHEIVPDGANPLVMYAATNLGVFKSVNGGDLWSLSSAGLPAFEVHALIQDGFHGGTLFAGTFGGGVFESVDAGASWIPVASQNGLASLNVRSLALDGALGALYAGTDDGVAVMTNYPALDARPAHAAALSFAVWPNPARSGAAHVSYMLTRGGDVRVDVLDVTGARVRTLEAGTRAAGTHAVSWDGRDEAGRSAEPGLYFMRLSTTEGVRTARLVRLSR